MAKVKSPYIIMAMYNYGTGWARTPSIALVAPVFNFLYLFKSPYIIMAQTQKSANYGSNSKVHILLWHQLKCPYIKVYMAPPLQFI